MKFILAVLAIICATAAVFAGEDQFMFLTPSGNIGCQFRLDADDSVYCVRIDPQKSTSSVPVPNAWVELGKGKATTGRYEGEVWYPDPAASKLAFGKSRTEADVSCTSRKTGLTCVHGKHGFTVSQKAIKVY